MSVALGELVAAMEEIAPLAGAEGWDNVGLIAGDAEQAIARVLLAIDLTHGVLAEAIGGRCSAVIAYHPPIFKPVTRLTASHVVFEAIRNGLAIYSPHTALDVAEGGTNDCLADAVGLMTGATREAITTIASAGGPSKLVTFVPGEAVERVSAALFAAGAGRIGKYTSCSFRVAGSGTFFGEAGTNPAVGQHGRLEEVAEIRLEMVVHSAALAAVVSALRKSHPYEEPAFDLIPLAAPPSAIGLGRIGTLSEPVERGALIERVKRSLGINHVLVAGPIGGRAQRVAVCAGSCGSVLDAAMARGAEVLVTGELRHHDALKAAAAGVMAICTLHSHSERLALGRLQHRLAEQLPTVEFVLSQMDRDPLTVV